MLSVSASTSSTTLALQKAILVYGASCAPGIFHHQDSIAAHATINDVDMSSGSPVLKAGRLVTQSDLEALVKGLTQSETLAQPAWIDTTMLAMGAGRMIWFTPECRRTMFFKKSSFAENTFDAQAQVPIPALIWVVMQGQLYVYAYKRSGRPTKDTALYQAPFFNVWSQGKVCTGNAAMPRGDAAAVTNNWVDAFFGSYFTHPNFAQKDRLVKGVCPIKFWQAMTLKPLKFFPDGRLVDIGLSVSDLLDVNVAQKISAAGGAQGEF